ncbi:hypothetical protein JCM3766R1_005421 [Sporobolomyces carnicolor]
MIEAGPEANTTFALSCVLVVLLVFWYKQRSPPPQLHPFLLGRQSLLQSPTRLPNQSPIYLNPQPYSHPKKNETIEQVVGNSLTCLEGSSSSSRLCRPGGGDKLATVVETVRAGLQSRINPREGKVLVAIDDPRDCLVVLLALATSERLHPIVLSPGSSYTEEDIVAIVHSTSSSFKTSNKEVVEIDLDSDDVSQDILATGKAIFASKAKEEEERKTVVIEPLSLAVTLIISSDKRLELSRANLTSSLVSWLSIFPDSPLSTRPTIKDTIYTLHHPATAYGLGLALFAISTSASLSFPPSSSSSFSSTTTVPSPEEEELEQWLTSRTCPPCTILFGGGGQVAESLYRLVLSKMTGDSSLIIKQSLDGKLRLLRTGSVSKRTVWDQLLFKGVRKDLGLHQLRALFLSCPSPPTIGQGKLETFRCAFGAPAVSTFEHDLVLAPVSHGHLYDYQRLPPPSTSPSTRLTGREPSHVGPPTCGVELKLVQVDEREIIEKGQIRGEILIRSPMLPRPETLPTQLVYTDQDVLPRIPSSPSEGGDETKKEKKKTKKSQWLRTGLHGEISTEGTLWFYSPSSSQDAATTTTKA